MSTDILLTLAVTLVALVLFVSNKVRVDVVGIIVMATLTLLGLVTLKEAVSGFSNEATVTVAAMFVLSAGLVRTGAIDLLARWMGRVAGRSDRRLLVVCLAVVLPLSAFINNTPVVVVMIPVVLGLTRKLGYAPSRFFMPISFGSQLGGTLTLIGTSTNLLVAGLLVELGQPRLGLFDITGPALLLAAAGVAYLVTAGAWLTPVRETTTDLVGSYELRDYLSGLVVEADSPLVGRTLRDVRFADAYGVQIIGIERRGERIAFPRGGALIEADDLLLVKGKTTDLARVEQTGHLRIAGKPLDFPQVEGAGEPIERPTRLAEVIVPPRSPVVGRTLRELNFRGRYGVPVLGIQRHGEPLHDRLRDVALLPGDVMLVQGGVEELRQLHASGDLALLGAVDVPARRLRKIKYALPIMALVVGLAAFDVMPILLAAILGCIAMFLTGCIRPDEAYREVDWMVLVLLATILPLGIAMQKTGAAGFIADRLVWLTEPLGLYGTLAAFYVLTSLLTELISNNATAIVLVPIAVATGVGLGASPMPFVIAVMLAASNSFMTPIGYQTNTFIYGPGGYRFSDFVRVGGPLNVMLAVLATFAIPLFFPF